MILRPFLILTSILTIVFAGFWPAFVDKAVLNVRQVIGATDEETTDAAGAGAGAATQQTQAAGNGAATAATQQTQAAGAGAAATAATTATPATAAANPATAATTPTTARAPAAAADTDTETTTTPTRAAAPAAAPAAPADDIAADPADFEVPYTMQTGTIRYAPMAVKVPSKITKKNATPLYPTSDYVPFTTKAGAGSVVVTVTQPFTFQTVSSEAKNIPAASPPADDMQKFLNRWKD